MSVRILIVDDEEPAIERLHRLLVDLDGIEVVGTARNAADASELIERLSPDLVLLDIELPGRTGLSLAAELRARGRPAVVFVTAHSERAVEGFEVAATDYLLKPVAPARLNESIERVRRLMPAPADISPTPPSTIWVQRRGESIRIDLGRVDWISAEGEYVRLHDGDSSYLYRASMTSLYLGLTAGGFVRVHRSHIVNTAFVKSIKRRIDGRYSITLARGEDVPVGRRYHDAVELIRSSK